jgi:hypothetical protein
MTGQDLLSSSLRLIGVLASGESPSATQGSDGLTILNQMVEAWGIEHLNIFTLTRTTFSLVPGTQAYTVGTGGTFNMSRPIRIDYVSILILNNPAQPLELPLEMYNDDQWQQEIPIKAITTTYPTIVYDDGGFPLRTLSFWPVPTVANQVILGTWTALNSFPNLVTDVTFPPGYLKALRYNLAVDLAPEYGVSVRPEVLAQAISSKAAVKSINIDPIYSKCDSALMDRRSGYFNYYTGESK